jgi:hypothetical protein
LLIHQTKSTTGFLVLVAIMTPEYDGCFPRKVHNHVATLRRAEPELFQ